MCGFLKGQNYDFDFGCRMFDFGFIGCPRSNSEIEHPNSEILPIFAAHLTLFAAVSMIYGKI